MNFRTTANEIALGGGITHGVKLFKNDPKLTEQIRSRHETFCIAFTKQKGEEPDFQAVSRVIEGNELSRRELNKELMELRKSIVMRSNSIGLRICCQAKRRKGKESLIFNAHFPNTPLFGVEVEGEVGWNSNLPQDKVAEQPESFRPKRCKVLYPKFQYEWSSIFVVITWGNIIEM